jgi:hypothetical protein
VKQAFVPPGQQPAMVRDLARSAVKFITDRDLVTVPPLADEVWRMEMMPPRQQLVSPFFLGGEIIQVAYPTDSCSTTINSWRCVVTTRTSRSPRCITS